MEPAGNSRPAKNAKTDTSVIANVPARLAPSNSSFVSEVVRIYIQFHKLKFMQLWAAAHPWQVLILLKNVS